MDRPVGTGRSGAAMAVRSVVLVIRHGPGSGLGVREMLDMALVLATFDCPVSVVLQDQGVHWAMLPDFSQNSPLALAGRLKSLPLYDIETLWVDQQALDQRGVVLHPEFPGKAIDRNAIHALCKSADCVLEA